MEEEVGKITHFFGKINVAAIKLSKGLKKGDKVRVKGKNTDFIQEIDSIQVDKNDIQQAEPGDEVGIKINNPIKGNETIYIIKD